MHLNSKRFKNMEAIFKSIWLFQKKKAKYKISIADALLSLDHSSKPDIDSSYWWRSTQHRIRSELSCNATRSTVKFSNSISSSHTSYRLWPTCVLKPVAIKQVTLHSLPFPHTLPRQKHGSENVAHRLWDRFGSLRTDFSLIKNCFRLMKANFPSDLKLKLI